MASTFKEEVKQAEKEEGYRYWIVKIEDFVDALSEEELTSFFKMLNKYNQFRNPKPINSYWLINRDEYDLPTVEDFLKALEPYKYKNDVVKLVNKIRHWELENGESFHDYFTHDTVKDEDWLPFLRKKGFNERADEIEKDTHSSLGCMDQQLLYDIYSYDKWAEELGRKDLTLFVEFLNENPYYMDLFNKFFEDGSNNS